MLVLYGFFPGVALAVILILFALLRLTSLAIEAMHGSSRLSPAEMLLGSKIATDAEGHPGNQVFASPRARLELSAEALGVLAFAVLIPMNIALYSRDFFSFRSPQGWPGAFVAGMCIAAYAYPHRYLKAPELSALRISWWAIPFAVAIPLLNHAVETRHPYLNLFRADRTRLAAERVLSLRNNVVAGRHSDWVMRYARQLNAQGRMPEAVYFYREALRLNPNDREAQKRLAVLEMKLTDAAMPASVKADVIATGSYRKESEPAQPLPRRSINKQLESIDRCTVMLIPVGECREELLQCVGHRIQGVLDLPVYISSDSVSLPPRSRVRGLATGPQWAEASLVQSFTNTFRAFPDAPVKYLLITPVDIFGDGTHFVFSATYAWGAVISSARFGEQGETDSLVWQRTAKQTLCALIKSFNVPISTDRACVTSYARTVEEFDAKGDRPNLETSEVFRQAVSDLNHRWREWQSRFPRTPAGRP